LHLIKHNMQILFYQISQLGIQVSLQVVMLTRQVSLVYLLDVTQKCNNV
jgi:hypothetical protein